MHCAGTSSEPRNAVPAAPDTPAQRTRTILSTIVGAPAGRLFAVRLWDGSVEPVAPGLEPQFTLVLHHPAALRRMCWPPTERALGSAYLRDDFDIEGDVLAAAALGNRLAQHLRSPVNLARLMLQLRRLPDDDRRPMTVRTSPAAQLSGTRHSRARDAAAVRYHYDAGNDFFALWLDREMVYSCAYFETGAEDVDTAQHAKLDLICRKLRLQPGERLLDIGCGWGALVRHAARYYGVEALGITLSEPQGRLARQRITEAGLADACRIEVRDYRDLPQGAAFDKVVSVGMFEHVGRSRLPAYFAQAYRLTKPGGLFLNHGIVTLHSRSPLLRPLVAAVSRRVSFIEGYVFPDGELITAAEAVQYAETAGFETRDLESLREHYALTLQHWVRRLEAQHAQAAAIAGETTYRIWRLYMAGFAHAFACGDVGITQTLFSKPDARGASRLPLTRRDLYHQSGAA